MTRQPGERPPRLGLIVLEYLGRRNEALAGDLLEGYQLSRSHWWFWRQLLWAIVLGSFRQPSEIRPLRLVDVPSWQPPALDFTAERRAVQTRGLAASPIQDAGGVGVAALVLLTLVVSPSAFSIVGIGAGLGIVAGCIRIPLRRRAVSEDPPTRHILFGA